ncbi:hypothetical protein K402DRAFT_103452 [Aulographum hederae CBS 113979]|uniref:Rad1-domain-containing protein n=1 Tax=Aulographum hederae CBS 113979 TaxID=1176131 RepID=A0A6G1GX74_9PEZI|nr:hypothetical protein K402DRAFT_103452 [Aulographum hederae CBS 113979]
MSDVSDEDDPDRPLFTAVSSSARQLHALLRCINFGPKAQVQISAEGLRFSVEESSAMEGLAFLDKSLFTTYQFNAPPPPSSASSNHSTPTDASEDTTTVPTFEISLSALLSTLEILSTTPSLAPAGRDPYSAIPSRNPYLSTPTAFSPHTLGLPSICTFHYPHAGSPLLLTLSEASLNLRTTAELTTYVPHSEEDIPFARDAVMAKIIMRASYLLDGIVEIASTNPDKVTMSVSSTHPFFSLSSAGDLGSAVVEFARGKDGNRRRDPSDPFDQDGDEMTGGADGGGIARAAGTDKPPPLLETFQIARKTRISQTYKFSLIYAAARALAVATKVSVRMDREGVLSLQLMVEVDTGTGVGAKENGGAENVERGKMQPKVCFVEFRFVPLVAGDREDEGDDDDEEEEGEGAEGSETEEE